MMASAAILPRHPVFITSSKEWIDVRLHEGATCEELCNEVARQQQVERDRIILRTVGRPVNESEPINEAALGTSLMVKVLPLNVSVEVAFISPELNAKRPHRSSITSDHSPVLPAVWSRLAHERNTLRNVLDWLIESGCDDEEDVDPVLKKLAQTNMKHIEVMTVRIGVDGVVHRKYRPFPFTRIKTSYEGLACCTYLPHYLSEGVNIHERSVVRLEVRILSEDEILLLSAPMRIFVKCLTGETVELNAKCGDTIKFIKSKIQDKANYPPDIQCLIFANRELEDSYRLSDYMYFDTEEITLYMVVRLRGGGGDEGPRFVNLENEQGITTRAFSLSAPRWRICRPGLSIEGVCGRENCEAFNQMVIMNSGYGVFDLIQARLSCPVCRSAVEPITCGFINCLWRWAGIKADSGSTVSSKQASKALNEYTRFNPAKKSAGGSGMAVWKHLRIFAEPLNHGTDECVICLENLPSASVASVNPNMDVSASCHKDSQSDGSLLSCGHAFHDHCITPWLQRESHCPLCRSETSDQLPSQPSEDQEQQTMSINRSTPESAFRASGKVSFSTPTSLISPSIDRSTTESIQREIGHAVDLSSEHQSPPQLPQLAGGSNDSHLVQFPADKGFQFFRHLSDSTVRRSDKRKLNDQSVAQSLPLSPSLDQSSDLSTGNSSHQSTNRLEAVAQLTKTSCDESKADTSNDGSDDSPASPPAGQASNQQTLQSIAQQIYKATEPRFTFAFLNNSQLVDKQQMVHGADVARFRQTLEDGWIYQTLVAMPEYIHISLDELRWQDVQLVDKWHLRSNMLKNPTIHQIPPVKHVPVISPLPADLVFGTGQVCRLTETKSNNAPDHHSNNQLDEQTTFDNQTTSELKNVMDGLNQIIETTLQIACDRSVDISVKPVINPFQNQSNDRVEHAEFHVQHGQTDIRVRVPVWRR